jgi:hypothetical protein
MSKSQRLRLSDVRGIFHLIGECRELGDDAEAWRCHMLSGLCRLTGAQLAIGGEARLVGPDRLMVPVHFVGHGWPTPAAHAIFLAWLKDPTVLDNPSRRSFHRLPGRCVTRTRQQLTPNRDYYRGPFFNEIQRASRLDHGMLSRCAIPGRDWLHEVILNRASGA